MRVITFALLATCLLACDPPDTGCTAGTTMACTCADGSPGVTTCNDRGEYGRCGGCPAPGVDAGPPPVQDAGPGLPDAGPPPGTDAGPEVFVCPDPRGCPSGCCNGTSCEAGTTDARCGTSGASCVTCPSDQSCAAGTCVPDTISCPDPAACPGGCCAGSVCQPGNTASNCGSGGTSCATCGAGEACSAGICEVPGCSVRNLGASIEDTCTGENICNCGSGVAFCEGTGTCVPAFGRIYRVGLTHLLLPARRPDGMCWDDPGCGAPDPYVVLRVDGAPVGMTPAGSDLYEGFWTPPAAFDATILAGGSLRLDVYDEDLTADDGAFACVQDPITAARLRSRDVGCTGALGTLEAVIVFVP